MEELTVDIDSELSPDILNEKSKEEQELEERELALDDQLKRLAAQKASQDAQSKAVEAIKEEDDEDEDDDEKDRTLIVDKEEE